MPLGVRIDGSRVTDEEIFVDDAFEAAPAPALLGVPLQVKRLADEQGRDDALCLATRLMIDPASGFAPPDWRSGGALGPLPPVLVVRSDGVPFTSVDWAVLDNYMTSIASEAEACHRRGKMPPNKFTADAFKSHIWKSMSEALQNRQMPSAFLDLVPNLAIRFPKGSRVKPRGLKKEELNGVVGVVSGRYDEEQCRVGVEFPAPHGLLSVKASSLEPEETYQEWTRKMAAEYGFEQP